MMIDDDDLHRPKFLSYDNSSGFWLEFEYALAILLFLQIVNSRMSNQFILIRVNDTLHPKSLSKSFENGVYSNY